MRALANLLHVCSFNDTSVPCLRGLTELRSLNLAYSNISDAGVEQLTKFLTALTYLSIDSRLINDPGLVHLPALVHLQTLDIFGCKVRRTVHLPV